MYMHDTIKFFFSKPPKTEEYWCLNLNQLGSLAYNMASQQLYWHS